VSGAQGGIPGRVRVFLPSQLHSYSGGLTEVDAEGATIAEVLAHLDARYPGMRFRIIDEQDRIRPHIRFFLGTPPGATSIVRTIEQPVLPGDVVHIVGLLSGG
jgi:hypothetical protein